MARLTFPDEGSRSSFRTAPNGRPLTSAAGAAALVYLDAGATTLADIQTTAGVAIAGSSLNLDAYSRFPLFLGPADGTDTLYVVVDGGPVSPMYARVDDRLDAVKATADAAETPAGAAAKVSAEATTRAAADSAEATARAAAVTAAQAAAVQRSNHTGTQLAATVSDFSTAVVTAASGAYVAVAATAPSSPAKWWMSTRLHDLAFSSEPGDRRVAITPALGFESTVCQEPSVWYAAGAWHMYYTGGSSGAGHRIGYATAASPLGPWTKNATAVLGGGVGGLTGGAYHASVFIESGVIYIHFVDESDNSLVKVATSTTAAPTTVTMTATTYALPSTGTLMGNPMVTKDGSTYYLLQEASTSANSWQLWIGTLAGGPTGALTYVNSGNPITSIRPSAGNATATTSGGWLAKEDGEYVLYYHAGPAGSLPTEIYRARTTDLTTDSWTIDKNSRPIVHRALNPEVDQVADPWMVQDTDGEWFMFFSAMDNTAPAGRIMVAPARPGLMRNIAGTWTQVGGDSTPSRSLTEPQRPAVAALSADISGVTSTTFADLHSSMAVKFIARGTRVLVRLAGQLTNTSTQSVFFQVTDGGSITKSLGSVSVPSASSQVPFSGMALLTGLNPGQRYSLKIQYKVAGGALYCRPVGLNAGTTETLLMTVEDVQYPTPTG